MPCQKFFNFITKAFLKFIIAFTVAAVLFSCGPSSEAEEGSGRLAHIRLRTEIVPDIIYAEKMGPEIDRIFKNLRAKQGFNGAVMVAKNGHAVYKNAFGLANIEKKDSNTVNTAFQLASVSKQFTAAAIMLLQEQGKLDYDDSLRHYFPELPYSNITIRHLLAHRSGLPNYMYFCDIYFKDHDTPISNTDLVKVMADSCPRIYYPPDTRHNYSNTGYSLLAAIVEKITGMAFEDFMQKEVFEPLDMNNTVIYNKAKNTPLKNAATGYTSGGRRIANDYMNGITGDKGVYSTLDDLLKWDQALYSEKLLKEETLEEAFSPANPELRGRVNYGYGWRLFPFGDEGKIVFHTGWWRGFKTFLMRDVKNRVTIVVLSNKENWYLNDINPLFDLLYDGEVSSNMFVRIR